MQVKDVAAAGAFMQVVDVLGDQPGAGDPSAQCGNRPVRGIRLDPSTFRRRHSYQPQTSAGSSAKAAGVARAAGS